MIHHWRLDYIGLSGVVEFVPIDLIKQFSLKHIENETETRPGVFEDITNLSARLLKEGLFYPGVIEISRETGMARLIFGNHRLMAFIKIGFVVFPVFVAVVDRFIILPEETGHKVKTKQSLSGSGLKILKPSEIIDFSSLTVQTLE